MVGPTVKQNVEMILKCGLECVKKFRRQGDLQHGVMLVGKGTRYANRIQSMVFVAAPLTDLIAASVILNTN